MNRCILVVEDQEDNRQILRDLLTNSGYELVEAEDGEQALTMAERQRPDLILMDVQIPLIVVTSYALSGDESKARAAGCNGYVSKPYSTRQLLATIQHYVP